MRTTTTTSNGLVEVRVEQGYRVWTLGAPPVNALSPELLSDVGEALDDAVADENTAVIVLTSGLKVFSGGADASWMAAEVQRDGIDALVETFVRTMDRFRGLCLRLRQSPLLVVAALNGHTLAGGLELAAACDLRFCADDERLRIGVPEMDLFGAMPSGGGGVQFLARIMPPSRALDFVLEAKPVSPQRAYDNALIDRLYPAAELLAATERFAADVAGKAGRIGVAAIKRAVLGGVELPMYEAQELDRALHWDAVRRGNFRRGVQSFVDHFASRSVGPRS
ncbi:enoyl-CoA hydratase/isomerase family protein [Pseudonocardia sichuanensis]